MKRKRKRSPTRSTTVTILGTVEMKRKMTRIDHIVVVAAEVAVEVADLRADLRAMALLLRRKELERGSVSA